MPLRWKPVMDTKATVNGKFCAGPNSPPGPIGTRAAPGRPMSAELVIARVPSPRPSSCQRFSRNSWPDVLGIQRTRATAEAG
jgi:hypothetical protein